MPEYALSIREFYMCVVNVTHDCRLTQFVAKLRNPIYMLRPCTWDSGNFDDVGCDECVTSTNGIEQKMAQKDMLVSTNSMIA